MGNTKSEKQISASSCTKRRADKRIRLHKAFKQKAISRLYNDSTFVNLTVYY